MRPTRDEELAELRDANVAMGQQLTEALTLLDAYEPTMRAATAEIDRLHLEVGVEHAETLATKSALDEIAGINVRLARLLERAEMQRDHAATLLCQATGVHLTFTTDDKKEGP